MSTICKICIPAPEDAVKAGMVSYFAANTIETAVSSTEWPTATEDPQFVVGEGAPTVYSVKEVAEGATEIHFNSFSTVADLASALSQALDCGLVVNQYQSTAMASYWAYHLRGQLLREIKAGDGEIYQQEGVALDFEEEPPGHDISEDGEEPLVIFDSEDLDHYNSAIGIPLQVYQEFPPQWVNYEVCGAPTNPAESAPSEHKPWWRFW